MLAMYVFLRLCAILLLFHVGMSITDGVKLQDTAGYKKQLYSYFQHTKGIMLRRIQYDRSCIRIYHTTTKRIMSPIRTLGTTIFMWFVQMVM